MNYVVSKIALKRRSELVEPPEKLYIHESFLMNLGAEDFSAAFRAIHHFFYELLSDIAKRPEESEENGTTVWPFYLLLYLFANGKTESGVFTMDVPSFRKANKGTKTVKHCENYLKILSEYGFVFEGLKNYKIPNNAETFTIEFPNMSAVVDVLHLVAEKCYKYRDFYSIALFFTWNYRLITHTRNEMAFEGHELLADGLKNKTEKEFVFRFHEAMKENGFVCKKSKGMATVS